MVWKYEIHFGGSDEKKCGFIDPDFNGNCLPEFLNSLFRFPEFLVGETKPNKGIRIGRGHTEN